MDWEERRIAPFVTQLEIFFFFKERVINNKINGKVSDKHNFYSANSRGASLEISRSISVSSDSLA